MRLNAWAAFTLRKRLLKGIAAHPTSCCIHPDDACAGQSHHAVTLIPPGTSTGLLTGP